MGLAFIFHDIADLVGFHQLGFLPNSMALQRRPLATFIGLSSQVRRAGTPRQLYSPTLHQSKGPDLRRALLNLVAGVGFEPTTFRL